MKKALKYSKNKANSQYDHNRYQGRRWVMIIHGQHPKDYVKMTGFFDTDQVLCACVGREFGVNKVHPHWQVYFELKDRVNNIRVVMSSALGHDQAHLEKAQGTQAANVAYIYAVDKPHEIGFVDYAKNVVVPARYNAQAAQYWNDFKPRSFQQDVIAIASDPVWEDRLLYWIYDTQGNTGKTKLAEYLHIYHGAIITGGKASDMRHAIRRWSEIAKTCPTIIIADLARSDKFTASTAKALESIKNGLFFDGKYESSMLHSAIKPHVLVFSNESPRRYRKYFSQDRWKVYEIIDAKLTLVWC